MKNDKGTGSNREGMGSTYAGTQTPDANAPDGYQKPGTKEDEKQELGKEYKSQSSYGNKDSKPDTKGVEKPDDGNAEEGSPIR